MHAASTLRVAVRRCCGRTLGLGRAKRLVSAGTYAPISPPAPSAVSRGSSTPEAVPRRAGLRAASACRRSWSAREHPERHLRVEPTPAPPTSAALRQARGAMTPPHRQTRPARAQCVRVPVAGDRVDEERYAGRAGVCSSPMPRRAVDRRRSPAMRTTEGFLCPHGPSLLRLAPTDGAGRDNEAAVADGPARRAVWPEPRGSGWRSRVDGPRGTTRNRGLPTGWSHRVRASAVMRALRGRPRDDR